jgi:transketolase
MEGNPATTSQPVVLVLTRQAVPTIDRKKYAAASGLACGAYVLADAPGADPRSSSSARAARLHFACKPMSN